ncbi:hypothetical protein [Rhodococcus sp. AH-ZY2]|uniref:hypothetical protein n=1 Tax=Rhodococcus sp. AH-ZY2 TaxID=3047468 RepID=UPI0027E20EA7|nr:hypothetical protein [Rhodococcus sp. AH-ZY2]WML60964.1 hypothetical protein QNA09_00215 [Rhodococcus sp. AH-ZY2]
MQHENVDKDPDLRKSSDLGEESTGSTPEPKWWQSRWARWGGAIVGAFAGTVLAVIAILAGFKVFGWITGDWFDSTDVGAAGAWASAVGATFLAFASVWLAVQANRQARKTEENAQIEAGKIEKRHRAELQAAERRLMNELDVGRRHQQVEALGPIWTAIATLEVPATNLEMAMRAVQWRQNELIKYNPGTPEHATANAEVKESANELRRELQNFAPLIMAAEISFTSALMLVDEPNTLQTLEASYGAFTAFRKVIITAANRAIERQTIDLSGIKPAKTALNGTRAPMVKAVRAHLTQSRPLRLFD